MPALYSSRFIFLCLIFVTGGVVLSLELIASRILAPFFGVSLYIWTAILSVTLTFLALGYQFGGWMTVKVEEKNHESLLMSIPIVSTFFIFLSCLAYPVVLPALSGMSLILGSFIGSFILLAFPLIFLSAVNPILIALFKQSTNSNDSGAGFVFFISTFGSVVGVIVTALLIVPYITNYSAMLVNGIILGVFTILTHVITQENRTPSINKRILVGCIIVIVLCSSLLFWKNVYLGTVTKDTNAEGVRLSILAEYPSHYGNVKVVGIIPKGEKEISHYALLQDGLAQNVISKTGKSLSLYTYILEILTNYTPYAKKALVLGFGAGVVPRNLREKDMKVSVVDINPDTLTIAKEYYQYKQNDTTFFFEDARIFVKKCDDEYDIAVLDLFHGDGVPEHIMTREFFQDIEECLNKDGVLVSNLFIGSENDVAKMSILATINSVFASTHYFQVEESKDNAYIVAAKTALPDKIDFNLDSVPKGIRIKVESILNSRKEYTHSLSENHEVISDDGNTFSSLFAKQYMHFRQRMVSQIPSRILIN